jgi:hypothetical protein
MTPKKLIPMTSTVSTTNSLLFQHANYDPFVGGNVVGRFKASQTHLPARLPRTTLHRLR